MGKKSWAHQELSRKRVKKYAALLTDEEVRAGIESRGMEPVFIGRDLEGGRLLWVLDNEVFSRYEIMAETNEDQVWEYAVKRYVFEHGRRRFAAVEELEAYVGRLNREKYAQL